MASSLADVRVSTLTLITGHYQPQDGDLFSLALGEFDQPRQDNEGRWRINLVKLPLNEFTVNGYDILASAKKIVFYVHSRRALCLSDTVLPAGPLKPPVFSLLQGINTFQFVDTTVNFVRAPEAGYKALAARVRPMIRPPNAEAQQKQSGDLVRPSASAAAVASARLTPADEQKAKHSNAHTALPSAITFAIVTAKSAKAH